MAIDLFVPGRLCLFGEHSDWAGMYRTINSDLEKGQAIVSGLEQGIYAACEISEKFIVESDLEFYGGERLECVMDSEKLMEVASGEGKEYGLTAVLDSVREKYGMNGYLPKARCFDIGLPNEYIKTIMNFSPF